jgi:hypothetical protein
MQTLQLNAHKMALKKEKHASDKCVLDCCFAPKMCWYTIYFLKKVKITEH